MQHTMASQKQSVCGSLSSPAVSGDVPRPLGYGPTLVTPKVTKDAPVASVDNAESFSAQSVETENRPLAEPIKSAAKTEVATYARTADARTNVASEINAERLSPALVQAANDECAHEDAPGDLPRSEVYSSARNMVRAARIVSSRPSGGLGEFTVVSDEDVPASASAATVPVLRDGVSPDNFALPPTLDGNVHSDDALVLIRYCFVKPRHSHYHDMGSIGGSVPVIA